MMNHQTRFSTFFLTLACLRYATATTHAQSPVSAPVTPPVTAPAPPLSAPPVSSSALAPSGLANITAILEKAGQYTTLIRLLKRTHVDDQITTLLNTTNTRITLFAPTDNAFSNLKPGTINSLDDQQQVTLVLFHFIPIYLTLPKFRTVTNPVPTQAGSDYTRFPMNITASGANVNITTGMVNTTVAETIYTDGQVAIYRVNKVLFSVGIVNPALPPPPAPAPSSKKAKRSSAAPTVSQDVPVETSNVNGKNMVDVGAALLALLIYFF